MKSMAADLMAQARNGDRNPDLHTKAISLLCALILNLTSHAYAQVGKCEVTGTVWNAETLEPLPSANLRVIGTTKGTAANVEGKYCIMLPSGTRQIIVSYVGYHSDTLSFELSGDDLQRDVFLQPTILALPEITVFPGTLNPAAEIIRRAIVKKKEVLSALHANEFCAYTKTVLRVRETKNDTVIGGILETQTKGYWKAPDQYKEVIVGRKQTANFPQQLNVFTAGRLPNLNDDAVVVGDLRIIGPTAPNAFAYYRFEMLDTTAIDNIAVWSIRVVPKTQAIPLFDGVIDIADQTFLVMGVDVRGNQATNVAPWTNARLRQQFALYEEKFWLPIASHVTSDIVMSFGPAGVTVYCSQTSVIHEYRINPLLPPAIFDRYLLTVLETADEVDSADWRQQQVLGLSHEENEAYRRIDSIMAVPNLGRSLAVFAIKAPLMLRKLPVTGFADFFHFNRVEGPYAGLGMDSKDYLSTTALRLQGGYGFANKQWSYRTEVEQYLTKAKKLSLGGEVYRRMQFREAYPRIPGAKPVFDTGSITWLCLLEKNDPVDYYLASGWSLFGRIRLGSFLAIEPRFSDEDQHAVTGRSNFSIFSTSNRYRPNPSILDGQLRSGIVSVQYDTRKFIDLGWLEAPDEVDNSWTMSAQLEFSSKRILNSDFGFARFLFNTHRLQHTLGPGKLDVHLKLGYSNGGLPPQRLFDLETGVSGIVPPGALRTARIKEFAGDKMAVLILEHNFGSMLFRAARLPLIQSLDLILYSGSGWSDISSRSAALQTAPTPTAEIAFHEIGFGLGRLMTFMRLDFSWRLTHRNGKDFAISLQSSLL